MVGKIVWQMANCFVNRLITSPRIPSPTPLITSPISPLPVTNLVPGGCGTTLTLHGRAETIMHVSGSDIWHQLLLLGCLPVASSRQ